MMTFFQFLEGKDSFQSRDPEYDLNLAADLSDDEGDSTHFLYPFMKKIKAFAYYCNVARWKLMFNVQRSHNSYWADAGRRHQRRYYQGVTARNKALNRLVATNKEEPVGFSLTRREIAQSIESHMSMASHELRDLFTSLTKMTWHGLQIPDDPDPNQVNYLISSVMESIDNVIKSIGKGIEDLKVRSNYPGYKEEIANFIKELERYDNQFKRMKKFLEVSSTRIASVMSLGKSKKFPKPYSGSHNVNVPSPSDYYNDFHPDDQAAMDAEDENDDNDDW